MRMHPQGPERWVGVADYPKKGSQLDVVLALSWPGCNGTGNWVFEMVVIISGLDDGQWYQGTDPTGAQTSLGLCQMPISMQDYSRASTEMAAGATVSAKNGTRKEETAPTASPIPIEGKPDNPRKNIKASNSNGRVSARHRLSR